MRIVPTALLWLCLITATVAAEEQLAFGPQPGGFEGYLRTLLEHHPGIKAIDAAISAVRERPSQAEALQNPVLGIGVMNFPIDPISFNSEPMTQKQISFSQTFPSPGKRRLQREVAEETVKITEARLPEMKQDLLKEAWSAFLELAYLEHLHKEAWNNREVLKSFVQVALAKYNVGKGLQQDVLRAQLEVGNMSAMLLELDGGISALRARLAVTAGLDKTSLPDNILPPALNLSAQSAEALTAQAESARPMFDALRSASARAEKEAEVAKSDLLPGYTVAVAYGQRDDTPVKRKDLVSASVALSLPLYRNSRQDRRIAESKMEAEQSRRIYMAERLKLKEQLSVLVERERAQEELLQLYDQGLLMQAAQSVDAAMAAYRGNKVDFLNLVMAQVALFNQQLRRAKVAWQLETARLEIQRLSGSDLMEMAHGK